MTKLLIVLDSKEPDLNRFHSEVSKTPYAIFPAFDIAQTLDELKISSDYRYLVIGQSAYRYVKSLIHLGPRSEGFYDLTKMDYLLTRDGIYFKFIYWRYKRVSKFVEPEIYASFKNNFQALQARFKDLETREGISKKSGKPWYMVAFRIPADPNKSLTNYINNDVDFTPVQIKGHLIIKTEAEIKNAFKALNECGEIFGLDYETSGFPFQDPNFYHMGVSIVTASGNGYYFDMDYYQRLARRSYRGETCKSMRNEPFNEGPFNEFFNSYKDFLELHAEECFTYNVSFEQRATYLIYNKIYFFREGSTINKLEGMNSKNYSLKYTAMRSLHVPSWDDDFEYLSSSMGSLMACKDGSKHNKDEIFYTNDLEKVEIFENNPDLDCETRYYKESDCWKAILEKFPDYKDEFEWFIENRWGSPFSCIPADILGKYCCIDSFNTVNLRLAATELGYSNLAWDCFDNNLRMGALLGIHGIICDEDYRVFLEKRSIPAIVYAKLQLCRWYFSVKLDGISPESRSILEEIAEKYPFKYYYTYNFNNLAVIVNDFYDRDKKEFDTKRLKRYLGEDLSELVLKVDLTDWKFDSPRKNMSLSSQFMRDANSLIKSLSIQELPNDLTESYIDECITYIIQNKRVNALLKVVKLDEPTYDFNFINEFGESETITGYAISDWVKDSIFNFNSSSKAIDIMGFIMKYFKNVIFEIFEWWSNSFDNKPYEEAFAKVYSEADSEAVKNRVVDGTTLYEKSLGNTFMRYFKIIEDSIKNPDEIETEPLILKRAVRNQKGELVFPKYNKVEIEDYVFNPNENEAFIRYRKGLISKFEFFFIAKDIEGYLWIPTGEYNTEYQFCVKTFHNPELEEVFSHYSEAMSAESEGAYVTLKSLEERLMYCKKEFRNRFFTNLIENKVDITRKTLESLSAVQFFFIFFRKYEKTLSTYINGQFTKYNTTVNDEDENLICTETWWDPKKTKLKMYSPFNVCEKQSKRWSATTHTIPSKSEVKRCIVAPKGYLMSYFDISGAEVRTAAFMSKCQFFMDCYDKGKDVYIEAAKIVDPDRDMDYYKEMRPVYKQILLGKFFGMGDEKLSVMTGSSLEDSIQRSQKMFDLMPEIEALIQEKAAYCVDHDGLCETFLGDKMIMEGKRNDQLSRLGVNQVIQGFTAVALADGFFNNIYQSYKTGEIKIRPVNVVHDSSQNYFETKKIFEIIEFYERNMRKYLYDKYKVDWDFDTECGVNYFDMVDLEMEEPVNNKPVMALKGNYISIKRLLDRLTEEGPKFSIMKITNEEGDNLVLTGDETYAEGFIRNTDPYIINQARVRKSVQSCYEMDKSKYKVIIRKEE